MFRVYLRPCATAFTAIGRRHARPSFRAAFHPLEHDELYVHNLIRSATNSHRSFSSKSKDKDSKKKASALHEKFDEEEDAMIIETPPPEIQLLAKEEMEETELDEEELEMIRSKFKGFDIEEDEDDNEEDSAAIASKIETEIANWDLNENQEGSLEDDRLHIEMPGYDGYHNVVSDDIMDDDEDEFSDWNHGMTHTPEMLNWMLPKNERQPFKPGTEKPWKYFVNSKHSDIVELALDTDLLRLFISPTGRIRPRRFTGLTAKQQRKLAQGIKISRQLGLLPYLSRYPEPSPEQWRQIHEEENAKLAAQLENMSEQEEEDDDDDYLEEFEAH